ncbi:MAG: SDR family oxidoreductase [Chloroflexi bacterium]|nr:MAG: SDR family oxidoreductase [Chloroflexota bacterium]
MSFNELLSGQVVVVTGAGRGIGRATALALSEAGAAVVLVARSGDQITGVADEIRQTGRPALAIATDVSDATQVDHLLVLTLRAFGRVDILVNNAAVVEPIGKVWETSPLAWQKLMAINVIGPYLCARAVLPHLLERGSGRIINVSSGAADKNLQGLSAYCASKAALERFSGTLAAEVEGTGVVVSVLRPGIVDTDMQAVLRETPSSRFPHSETWQKFHRENQLRSPREPALAITWLASRFGADSNGQTFTIDDDAFRQRIAADLGVPPLPPRQRNRAA